MSKDSVGTHVPNPIAFPDETDFSMPDISDLATGHMNFVYWGRLFWGMRTEPFIPSALLVMLARLCDKVVEEYSIVRKEVLNHFSRKMGADITHLMGAISHMETLVSTLWRAMGAAETVRRDRDAPAAPGYELPGSSDFRRVNGIRRAIEHMDKRIRDGRAKPGVPTMVVLDNHSITLEGWEIAYHELAWWIAQMSNLVLRLRAAEAESPSDDWPGVLRMFAAAINHSKAQSRSN